MLFQAFRLWGRHRDLPARLFHEINAWVNRLIVRVGSLGTKSTESMKKSYLATYRETKNTDVIKTPDFNLLISISLQTSLEIVFLFLSTISWFKIQWKPSPLFFLCRGEGAATRRLVPGSQIVGKTRKYKAREKLLGREKGKRKGQRAFSPLLSPVYFRFSFVFAHAQFSGPSRSL